MKNLTEIDKPFCFLSKKTQKRLVAHGGPYEYLGFNGNWELILMAGGVPGFTYRVAPQTEPTQDSIDWTQVSDWVKCQVRDRKGKVFHCSKKPYIFADTDWASGGNMVLVESHASLVIGTCDWRDSLIVRPGADL